MDWYRWQLSGSGEPCDVDATLEVRSADDDPLAEGEVSLALVVLCQRGQPTFDALVPDDASCLPAAGATTCTSPTGSARLRIEDLGCREQESWDTLEIYARVESTGYARACGPTLTEAGWYGLSWSWGPYDAIPSQR
ncbi:MAG: hypothetical protein ACQEXJ_20295 [Myxococcota bacterium]